MRTPTPMGWLARVLTALTAALLLHTAPSALADWADASGYLSVTQTPRAFDRTTRQIFSYVTVTNTGTGTATGPLRLVVPTSNFVVDGPAGTTGASEPYVDLPAAMAAGQKVTLRVNFVQQRGALAFTTRPERYSPTSVAIGMPTSVPEGLTAQLTSSIGGPDGSATYLWTQTGGPDVGVTGKTTDALTFVAPTGLTAPVTLTFQLTVTDSSGSSTVTRSMDVVPDAILVDAGKDRTAQPGDTVSLHAKGHGSGPSPAYLWTQVAGPDAGVTGDTTSNPLFVVPNPGDPGAELVFQVSFTDGVKTATDQVRVTIPPVTQPSLTGSPLSIGGAIQGTPLSVIAPPAAEVPANTIQQLAALANGGDGSYTWLWKYKGQAGGPSPDPSLGALTGSVLDVTLPAVASATTYAFEVTVTDGSGDFFKDSTTLFVSPSPGTAPLDVVVPPLAVSEGPYPATIAATAQGGTGPYSYSWIQTAGPTVTLTGTDQPTPHFVPPAVNGDTTLTFKVTVTDANTDSVEREVNVLVSDTFAYTPPQVLRLQPLPGVDLVETQSLRLAVGATGGTPPYTWSWTQTGGTAATLAGTGTDTLTVTAPDLNAPETLTFQVTATDNGGTPQIASESVTVSVLLTPPAVSLSVAQIPSLHVDEGQAVVVPAVAQGGSGSYSYSWQFVPDSVVASLALTDATTSVVRFTAPDMVAKHLLQLELTVTDGIDTLVQTVSVVVNDITPPLELKLANPDTLNVHAGDTVALTGGTASGGQGPYVYSWAQTQGTPVGALTGATTPNPTFTAPAVTATTALVFEMTVTDALGNQVKSIERVSVQPAAQALVGSLSAPDRIPSGTTVHVTVSLGGDPGTTYGVRLTLSPDLGFKDDVVVHGGSSAPSSGFVQGVATNTPARVIAEIYPQGATTPALTLTQDILVLADTAGGHTCVVCGDLPGQVPCTDMELLLADATQCPTGKPYCMNSIVQRHLQVAQYRYCADLHQAQTLWYDQSSDEPLCLNFDLSADEETLTCHLACFGDQCNIDVNPPDATLYRP